MMIKFKKFLSGFKNSLLGKALLWVATTILVSIAVGLLVYKSGVTTVHLNSITSYFDETRDISFIFRFLILLGIFIFWSKIINYFGNDVTPPVNARYLVILGLFSFDIVFIYRLPFHLAGQ